MPHTGVAQRRRLALRAAHDMQRDRQRRREALHPHPRARVLSCQRVDQRDAQSRFHHCHHGLRERHLDAQIARHRAFGELPVDAHTRFARRGKRNEALALAVFGANHALARKTMPARHNAAQRPLAQTLQTRARVRHGLHHEAEVAALRRHTFGNFRSIAGQQFEIDALVLARERCGNARREVGGKIRRSRDAHYAARLPANLCGRLGHALEARERTLDFIVQRMSFDGR